MPLLTAKDATQNRPHPPLSLLMLMDCTYLSIRVVHISGISNTTLTVKNPALH